MKSTSILSQTRSTRVPRPFWAAIVALFAVLTMAGSGLRAAAQSDETIWEMAVNLSHSGAASRPVIVAQPNGGVRVFWWDHFDGVTMAEAGSFSVSSAQWSDPLPTQIVVLEPLASPAPDGSDFVARPITQMPTIFGDRSGQAHAVWLGEADRTTGVRQLLHARLGEASTNWTTARVLAESAIGFSATVDAAGSIHLVYMRALNTAGLPSGVYYRRSDDGGASWGTSSTVYLSRYLRLLSVQNARLSVAADDAGSAYVTWDDPQVQGLQVAVSVDGGSTWQAPSLVGVPVDGGEGRVQSGHVVSVPGRDAQFFREVLRPSGACELYQSTVQDLLAGDREIAERVLPQSTACLTSKQFLNLGDGRVLLAAERNDGVVLLATWDGSSWHYSRPLAIQLNRPERGERVQLGGLQFALSQGAPTEGEPRSQALAIVGTGQNGEAWITGGRIEGLETLLAPILPTPTPTPLLRLPGTEEGQEVPPPQPANLSRSGAASNPSIVTGPDGRMRAFWWDAFDGLMVADGAVWPTSVLSGTQAVSTTLDIWSDAVRAQVSIPDTAMVGPGAVQGSGGQSGSMPINVMPHIVADAAGRSHAFWLQGGAAITQRLLYSSLDETSVFWSPAEALAKSAVVFEVSAADDGSLHLVYLRSQHTGDAAAGVYYRRSDDGGATWSVPAAVDTSRYYRLLAPESAHVRVMGGQAGSVYVVWDHPHQQRLLLASSFDGGATWDEPTVIGGPDARPQHGRLFGAPGASDSELWLMWEDPSQRSGCRLYQASVSTVLSEPETTGRQVLDGLTVCPQAERFLATRSNEIVMVVGAGSDALTLAAWDGERWSEPRRQNYRFVHPATGEQVYLGSLQAVLVESESAEAGSGDGPAPGAQSTGVALVAVGIDQQGDLWASPSQTGALDVVFAPLSPWSTPEDVSSSPSSPDLAAMVADAEGRVHALWAEPEMPGSAKKILRYAVWDRGGDGGWTRPSPVLAVPNASVDQPTVAVLGNYLHALWIDDASVEVWHSRAFVQDAYAPGGWAVPQPLPLPESVESSGAGRPHIAARDGVLHAVYAVPVNEGRGIYYVRSEDEGESWLLAGRVFDAVEAGWMAADTPRLAVDREGKVHVVWVHASAFASQLPQGVSYASSEDDGKTWSEPVKVAEGAYSWPRAAVGGQGQVHVLWSEAVGGGVWHRWLSVGGSAGSTADGSGTQASDGGHDTTVGEGWSRVKRVPGFRDVSGPVGLAGDDEGRLHLVGMGYNDAGEPALLHDVWRDSVDGALGGGQWDRGDSLRLVVEPAEPGVSIALQPVLRALDVVYRGQARGQEDDLQVDLWHTGRVVSPAVAIPPTVVPALPEATPVSLPTPDVTPTMTAQGVTPSSRDGGSLPLPDPLVLGSGLAVLVVGGVLGIRLLSKRRR